MITLTGTAIMRRGLFDSLYGNDFDPDYDAWSEHLQVVYEMGRLTAAAGQRLGIPFGAWEEKQPVPHWVGHLTQTIRLEMPDLLP